MTDTRIVGRPRTVARLGIAVLFAALVLGLGTGAASAKTRVDRQENTYLVAAASWCTEAQGGETCTDVNLEYIEPAKDGGRVACLGVTTFVPGPEEQGTVLSSEQGCAEVAKGDLRIAHDLSAATLAPTTVDLFTYVCEGGKDGECSQTFTRQVTIAVAWTGDGDLLVNRSRSTYPQNDCTVTARGTTRYRPAATTITFDGEDLAGWGELQHHRLAQTLRCPS
jgi:hypothetical protein